MDTILTEAKTWFRGLSINQQKDIANQYLETYEVAMLIGDTAKYTPIQKWNSLHVKLYKKYQK